MKITMTNKDTSEKSKRLTSINDDESKDGMTSHN